MLSTNSTVALFREYFGKSSAASCLPYALAPLGAYGAYKLFWYFVPGPHNHKKLILKDKTVLITGASTGLGRAMAFEFYAKGAKVILTARSIDKLEALCKELEETGRELGWENEHRPVVRYLDISELNGNATKYSQIDELIACAIDGKTIDVLVNNAGVSNRGSCAETSMEVQRRLMEVNYFGHVAVTRALLKAIPDDGAIVTVASVQSKLPMPYRSAYSASKHALGAFFDCLRAEDRPKLQILVVSPGYVNTGFGTRALDAHGRPVGVEDVNQLKGMGPEHVARRIVSSLERRETELVVATASARLAIYARFFAPNLLWWLLHRRAKKEQQQPLE